MEKIGDQLPTDNSTYRDFRKEVPFIQADEIVEGLVKEYATPEYKKWYYKLVYELGPQTILDLQKRCRDGKTPGRLFASLAKQMLTIRLSHKKQSLKKD